MEGKSKRGELKEKGNDEFDEKGETTQHSHGGPYGGAEEKAKTHSMKRGSKNNWTLSWTEKRAELKKRQRRLRRDKRSINLWCSFWKNVRFACCAMNTCQQR
jgi:hypothetical protein